MTRTLLAIAGGVVAGAALAGVGLAMAPEAVDPVETSTTTVIESAPRTGPWWFSPSETRIGPTAVILEAIDFEEGEVVVRYELRDIAPPALGRVLAAEEINPFFAQPVDDAIVAPETWVLETTTGEFTGTSENTRVRTARFDVPDEFVLGTVTGLRVESYRMRMPYVYEFAITPEAGARVQLDEGFIVEMRAVLPQAESTIFQIDYETPSDDFTAGEPTPAIIRGIGVEWESYSQRQFEGLQLILGSTEVPDPLPLEVRSTYWVPFQTSVAFDLGGTGG